MWPFSRVQQWQWLVPEGLLGMNDPYVRLDLMWMGSLLVFFCVFPGLILQIIFSCSDTLEMTSTQRAQRNWQNHAFLHELGQRSTFSSSKIFEKNRKTARCFPTSYKSGYNGHKSVFCYPSETHFVSAFDRLGQGPWVARAPSFPPVRQMAVSSGAFGSCRNALRDAGWCRMLVWWWWVWGYGWKKLKKTAGGLTNWSIFLDVDNFQVLFVTFLSALGRSLWLQKGLIH